MVDLKKASIYAVSVVRRISWQLSKDRITVYAAQASFFVIISVVPFLSLLISNCSFFLPADVSHILNDYAVPTGMIPVIDSVITDLQNAPNISLLSLSAITTFWSASRGVAAIQKGVATVYQARVRPKYFMDRLRSLISTLVFIVLIISMVVLILFGSFVENTLGLMGITNIFLRFRWLIFLLAMCGLFLLIYVTTAKRSIRIKNNAFWHLPGAVFATLGWIAFSYIYSLYIRYFPNASYIYGSLAAVCLMMLWLYVCMIILLLGAEVNKYLLKQKFHLN